MHNRGSTGFAETRFGGILFKAESGVLVFAEYGVGKYVWTAEKGVILNAELGDYFHAKHRVINVTLAQSAE